MIRRARAIGRAVVVGLGLLGAAGCGAGESSAPRAPRDAQDGGITSERFAEIYIALRLASRDAATVAAFNAAKDSILAAHSVTEDELLRFARELGSDVRRAAELWESIETRISPPRDADENAEPPPSTSPRAGSGDS